MIDQTHPLRRSRQTLVLLGAMFFAPFIAAWVVYTYFPESRPTGRTNYGELIVPARPLPAFSLRDPDGKPISGLLVGKWTLLYLGAANCEAECRERLVLMRQVRLALGKDLSRLQRVYVAPDAAALTAAAAALTAGHPGLHIVADSGAGGQRLADFFTAPDAQALYLVDPNGNWLMFYAGKIEPKPLLGDLKKLLRLSNIG